jgi:hypothetical protein
MCTVSPTLLLAPLSIVVVGGASHPLLFLHRYCFVQLINSIQLGGQSKGQYTIKTTWFTGTAGSSDEILSYEIGLCNN